MDLVFHPVEQRLHFFALAHNFNDNAASFCGALPI
jgi:hypothetical protein